MSAATTLPAPPCLLDLPTGLYPGIDDAVYHQRVMGLASKHVLDLIADPSGVPAYYPAYLAGQEEADRAEFRFGRAFHCAVLEPERFSRECQLAPKFGDCRKKENKQARDAWLLEHGCPADVIEDHSLRERWLAANCLSQEDYTTIVGMSQAVSTHPAVVGHLYRGAKELTARWRDDSGAECKLRADLHDEREGVVLDLKSCRKAGSAEFAKSVANYRYHVQDAVYRDGMVAAGGGVRSRDPFLFVAVEKEPPYAVAVWYLDEDAVRYGRKLARRDLDLFARCLDSGTWPGFSAEPQPLSLPRWAFSQ